MILEQLNLNRSRITVGVDCFTEGLSGAVLESYSGIFVISQEKIWQLHGRRLEDALAVQGRTPILRLVPDGEQTKNLEMFGALISWLARQGADRKSLLLVLGGGVVGDLSGFVASAFMRGIDWIYFPTTLLAQQDASVGGKVAVNLPMGKNMAGHFWEPCRVIIDARVLETLPKREINAGYMEFLKHGILEDEELYQRALALPCRPDWAEAMPLLAEGLKVKIRIVAEDPHERNTRRLLNLGHTFGHALESYTGYQTWLHGEAVGIGLIFATLLSRRLGGRYDWADLFPVVKRRVPPVPIRQWDGQKLLDLIRYDKKGVKGIVSWIIPFQPGKVEIVAGVSREILDETYNDLTEVLG